METPLQISSELILEYLYQVLVNWVVAPLMVVMILPTVLLLIVYVSAFYYFLYGAVKGRRGPRDTKFWERATYNVAVVWEYISWLWHGYEVVGLENIPDEGPAILVFYHGALPVDWYFLLAHTIVHKRRLVNAVGDKFLFQIPGLGSLLEALKVCTGTVETCSQVVKEGGLLAISPGGVREALFGDENYRLIWGSRVGFAKVALEGKAPIIPVFTQNLREAYCSCSIGKSWLRKFYEKTRLPIVPIYGGFPVKMRTYLGKPIPYDPEATPQILAQKTARAIEELRDQHQVLPGSITRALLDRFMDKSRQKYL